MPGPGWIVTPQGMLDYMAEVDRYVDAIAASVAPQSLRVPAVTLAAWARFVADWKAFYEAHKPFLDRLSGSVADTTERYEVDATQWRKVLGGFVDLGGVVFDPDKRPGGPSLPDVAPSLELATIALIAVAAVMVLRR